MPGMPEDTTERCFKCTKKVGRANLKACAQCHLVRYCSKECQRAAWPDHKQRCKLGALSAAGNISKDANEFANAMTKWLAHWKQTLAMYCIPAMDLPNHGPDRLVKYCIYIEIERVDNAPNRASSFKMVSGEIMARQDFMRFVLSRMRCDQATIDSWDRTNRGPDTLQLFLGCREHMRCLWLNIPGNDLEYFRTMDPTETAVLAMVWEKELKEKIASGRP